MRCQSVAAYSPFRTGQEVMQILTALLAEVVLRHRLLLHDAHAATVLPDLAFVALNEETTDILGLEVGADRQILIV